MNDYQKMIGGIMHFKVGENWSPMSVQQLSNLLQSANAEIELLKSKQDI